MESKKTAKKELSNEQQVKKIHKKACIVEEKKQYLVFTGDEGIFLAVAKNPGDAWKKALHSLL